MLFKLSLTGVKSRLKDYTVLFSGLAAASMIFYMFLSLATNPQFLKSSGGGLISAQTTTVTFGFGTVLLAILTLVYLFYANGFLLSMRKRDYGMYMMLGAKASKIGQLIFLETLVTGFLATGIGLILGDHLNQACVGPDGRPARPNFKALQSTLPASLTLDACLFHGAFFPGSFVECG